MVNRKYSSESSKDDIKIKSLTHIQVQNIVYIYRKYSPIFIIYMYFILHVQKTIDNKLTSKVSNRFCILYFYT